MKLPRREFLKLSGAGLVSLAGMSLLSGTGCSGVQRKDVNMKGNYAGLKEKLGDKRCDILYYASLAPSPHNTQPWYVKIIDQNNWIICADQSRHMKTTDPENHRLMLSLGLFAENLSLAAGALGLSSDIKIISQDFSGEDIVQVSLSESEPTGYPLERILKRKTVKNGFINKLISDEHIQKLSEPLQGHFFYFPREKKHAECIRESAVSAFKKWLDSDVAMAEHVTWLRISNSEARQKRDGLTTEGMEIKGITGLLVRTFFSNKDFAGSFMKKQTMNFTEKTSGEGSGFVILTGYGRTVPGMIELGRRFCRMLLTAREMKIAIQPMTQIFEMPTGRDPIDANHMESVDPQLVLRIGYVDDYPEPVTLRRPVEQFVRFV